MVTPNPENSLAPGGPTGAAIPLAWAHAEYTSSWFAPSPMAACSTLIDPVRSRYSRRSAVVREPIEVWSRKRPVRAMAKGRLLRVIGSAAFTLTWSWR